MNILIAGGAGTFLNNIITKLSKEGHKVSVLSGNRFASKDDYRKTFEFYNFPYDANCLNEIFESVSPDITIFMGAFDTNFEWKNEEADAVKYTASLANILMGYAMFGKGRFIYLSSHEVFGDFSAVDLDETTAASPSGFKAQAIYQGENMCENYRENRNMDIVILRMDHIYNIPMFRKDVKDTVTSMCLEALGEKTIHYSKNTVISPLFESDAVEAINRFISAPTHKNSKYHIASNNPMQEEMIANVVRDAVNPECTIYVAPGTGSHRCVLDGSAFIQEFGNVRFSDFNAIVKRIAQTMKSKVYVFLTDEETQISLFARFRKKAGWFIKAVIPFIENILIFIPCLLFYNSELGTDYFARLDIFLLYVLLFAIVHGQQQATFSALLAVVGFFLKNTQQRTGFELLLDANTYVWIAQIFIVGLSVGYLRDQIVKLKKETAEEREFLKQQIDDIQVINSTNARVKDVLETQVVNQADSVGKIYSITSSLDQYSPEEVLFYAAETVGKVMKSKDVAIYLVSNPDYARLFSSTSEKARSLGNSIKYPEMGPLYEAIASGKVYINRNMDSKYPLMANAIYENEKMQMIIMIWGLSWENMTLGQANQLVVVSSLIQNAVLRANRYIAALEDERYEKGTHLLAKDSFRSLVSAFLKAERANLTECTLVRVDISEKDRNDVVGMVTKSLRQSDYLGSLDDNAIYALLSNTSQKDASFVLNRFKDAGLKADIVEESSI